MLQLNRALIIFGVFAVATGAHRVIRSPDKMEVNVPSYEREGGEYQANMSEEGAHWRGEGDKLRDKEKQERERLEEDRDKNKEKYEHDMNHLEEQQNNYSKELNETYQGNRDKAEAHHESNQDHYTQLHNDTCSCDTQIQRNRTAEDLTETDTGNRYEEKGKNYTKEGKEKIENYDVNRDSPSISYTKT